MYTRRAVFWTIPAIVLLISAGVATAAGPRLEAKKPPEIPKASPAINPIGGTITISNESNLGEVNPAVAYNSVRKQYLVVWYNDRPGNDDIRAQRVSNEGNLVGPPFYISAAGDGIDRRYPRVAYNSKSDQYLVVWEHQEASAGYSVHGRRVRWDGILLDATDLVIRSAGYNLYTPKKPAVAYAYSSDKYLVIWDETWHPLPINTDICGQVVLPTGVLEGPMITISHDSGGAFRTNPDLAYNLGRNEYLVAWEQLDPDADPTPLTDIYTRRVTGSGELLFPEETRLTFYTVSTTAPAVAAIPISPDGQYAVVWEFHYSQNDWDILGVTVSPDGIPQDGFTVTYTNEHDTRPTIAGSRQRGQYLVAWKRKPIQGLLYSHIPAQLVTTSSSLFGDSVNLGGLVAANPRVAAGEGGDFLMVYDDTPLTSDSGIYGRLSGDRVYLPMILK